MATRRQILREARKDAADYFREFGRSYKVEGLDWVTTAWAELRQELKLSADDAIEWQPVWWDAFCEEAVRLEMVAKRGR